MKKDISLKKRLVFDKLTLELKVQNERLEVALNNKESIVYCSLDIKRWGVLENYFKARNYLQTNNNKSCGKLNNIHRKCIINC